MNPDSELSKEHPKPCRWEFHGATSATLVCAGLHLPNFSTVTAARQHLQQMVFAVPAKCGEDTSHEKTTAVPKPCRQNGRHDSYKKHQASQQQLYTGRFGHLCEWPAK